MVRGHSTSGNRVALHWYVGSLAFGWTLVIVGLLIWESIGHYDYARVLAQAEAGLPFQMKPLYMLRQLHEIGQDVRGFRTHIASLGPLHPENAPDVWEAAALRAIVKGSPEGSYGYPTLSEVAKSLELAAKAEDVRGAAAALAGVKEVCAAIQAGWTGDTQEVSQP